MCVAVQKDYCGENCRRFIRSPQTVLVNGLGNHQFVDAVSVAVGKTSAGQMLR